MLSIPAAKETLRLVCEFVAVGTLCLVNLGVMSRLAASLQKLLLLGVLLFSCVQSSLTRPLCVNCLMPGHNLSTTGKKFNFRLPQA